MEDSIRVLIDLADAGMMHLVDVANEFATLCMECAKEIENFASSLCELLDELEIPMKPDRRKLRPDYRAKCKIRWLDIPNKIMQGRIRRYC